MATPGISRDEVYKELDALFRYPVDHPRWRETPLLHLPIVRRAAEEFRLRITEIRVALAWVILQFISGPFTPDSPLRPREDWKPAAACEIGFVGRIRGAVVESPNDYLRELPPVRLLARDGIGNCYSPAEFASLSHDQRHLVVRQSLRSMWVWKTSRDPFKEQNDLWTTLLDELSEDRTFTKDILYGSRERLKEKLATFFEQAQTAEPDEQAMVATLRVGEPPDVSEPSTPVLVAESVDTPDPSEPAAPPPDADTSLTATAALDTYRACLQASVLTFPEWQPLFEQIAVTPPGHISVTATALAGKTVFARALFQSLLASAAVPLYLDATQYASFASEMDILRFAVEHGEFRLRMRDADTRQAVEKALADNEAQGKLVLLADQLDGLAHLPENVQATVLRRLEPYHRLVTLERWAALPFTRPASRTISLPALAPASQGKYLAQCVQGDIARLDQLTLVSNRLAVSNHLGWLKACALAYQRTPERYHDTSAAAEFVNMLVGQIPVHMREDFVRLLEALASAMLGLDEPDLHKEFLNRAGVYQALRSTRLFPEMKREVIDERISLAQQIGIAYSTSEGTGFADPRVKRYLAAAYFVRHGEPWIVLRPGLQDVVTWGAASLARRGDHDRIRQVFAPALVVDDDPLGLRALELAASFGELLYSPTPFTRDGVETLAEMLQRLTAIQSQWLRMRVREAASRLKIQLAMEDLPEGPEMVMTRANLKQLAPDPRGIEAEPSISPGKRVAAFVEAVRQADPPEAARCAGLLLEGDLNLKIGGRLIGRPAYEMLARTALDPEMGPINRALARGVLLNPRWILALLRTGNLEYEPLVYTLAIHPALDIRPVLRDGQWGLREVKPSS